MLLLYTWICAWAGDPWTLKQGYLRKIIYETIRVNICWKEIILLLTRKYLSFHRWLILWRKINFLSSAETLDNSLHWLLKFDHILRMRNVFASHETHQHIQELKHDHRFHFFKNIQRRSNEPLTNIDSILSFLGQFTLSYFGSEQWAFILLYILCGAMYKIYIYVIERFEKR